MGLTGDTDPRAPPPCADTCRHAPLPLTPTPRGDRATCVHVHAHVSTNVPLHPRSEDEACACVKPHACAPVHRPHDAVHTRVHVAAVPRSPGAKQRAGGGMGQLGPHPALAHACATRAHRVRLRPTQAGATLTNTPYAPCVACAWPCCVHIRVPSTHDTRMHTQL